MNLNSLPTDNFYKFLFFLGLAMIGYELFSENNDKEVAKMEALLVEYKNELSEPEKILKIAKYAMDKNDSFSKGFDILINNYQKTFDSLAKGYRTRRDLFDFDLDFKRYKDSSEVWKKWWADFMPSVNELSPKVESLAKRVENSYNAYKLRLIKDMLIFILGFILLSIGLFKWLKLQGQKDKISDIEYAKAVHEGISLTCQSCGMNLKYAKEIRKNRYCSYCYGNIDYNLQEATLEEFKTLVSDRMKEQGFSEKQITEHLNSLPELDRWKEAFRWD